MGTKLATEPETSSKPDPKVVEFETQKRRFEEAVAKTKAEGGTVPDGTSAEPAAEPEPKPAKKPKRAKLEPSPLEQEVAALKAQIAELAKPKEESRSDEHVDRARARLAERFGEEEAIAMLETFEDLREGDRRELAEMRRVLEEATRTGRANLSRTNQKRLVSAHPQLKNAAAWSIVHERALQAYQAKPKDFDSIEDAYDEVVSALYGEPEEPAADDGGEAPEEIERAASRIAASQMTVPTKAPRRESRSKEERAKEHFDFLKKHPEDKLGALRLAKELGLRR